MPHRRSALRRRLATILSVTFALTAFLTVPNAGAQGLPEQVARAAVPLADTLDPTGTLAGYVREAADGLNGPLLAPGAPAWDPGQTSCRTDEAHPRPVILVHGTFDNGPRIRAAIGDALSARGFCVVAPTLGAYAGNPGRGELDSIQFASGPQLALTIDRVREVTGAAQVDLVGYSQGAAVAGYAAKVLRPGQVGRVVSVGGYWGAGLAGMLPVDIPPPLAQAALYGANLRGLAELLPGSPLMATWYGLGGTPFQPGTGYTLIASRDDHTVPPARSFVPGDGVRHVVLQDGCEGIRAGHGAVLSSARTHALVADALGVPELPPCS